MRFSNYIIAIVLPLILQSCTNREITISADFDRGSIGHFKEIAPGQFSVKTRHWLKRDGIGDQYYWFYFKVDNAKDQNTTFELENLKGVYRGNPHLIYSDYTKPVFSYDQQNWSRIQDISYDSAAQKLTFTHTFDSSPVWIAYAHPYPYHRLLSLLSSIKDHDFVNVEAIASTKENRQVELVTITDHEIPNRNKKTIFLMAMQHPGEDAGSYFIEGMINFLLSEGEDAVNARKKFVFKLIPMMNPDGVFNGTSRYNMEMEDLNNIWLNEEKMQPEVKGVQQWVQSWLMNGNRIDMFWDVHNHTQYHTYNVLLLKDDTLNSLRTVMNKYWPMRVWHSEPQGSAHAYFYMKGIPSASLELTQSFSEEGGYLTISDYQNYGKATVLGFNEYFN